jgi:hypothetical protein
MCCVRGPTRRVLVCCAAAFDNAVNVSEIDTRHVGAFSMQSSRGAFIKGTQHEGPRVVCSV